MTGELTRPGTRPASVATGRARATRPAGAPHVLVVGTGQGFPRLLRAADDRVAVTVLCRAAAVARVREPERLREVATVPDCATAAGWVTRAREIHDTLPVSRVVAFGELDQDAAAAVGAALGVPATSPTTVELVHDKAAMRCRLRDLGVDPTPSITVTDAAGIHRFLATHGPCVVKPVQGAGSAGVAVVTRPAQAEAAFALASTPFDGIRPAGVLVEQFHIGPQYSVEAFSEGGEHVLVGVVRKFSDPATTVELGHVTPADLTDAAAAAVAAFVPAVLDGVGITDGPSHTELVLTDDGPRLIETHVRLAGDGIPDLVHRATGVDLEAATARLAVGQPVLPTLQCAHHGYAATWFTLPPVGGRLVALYGADGVEPLLDPGDEIATPLNSDSRVAQAVATAGTAADAVAVARTRAERVRVVVALAPVRPTELL